MRIEHCALHEVVMVEVITIPTTHMAVGRICEGFVFQEPFNRSHVSSFAERIELIKFSCLVSTGNWYDWQMFLCWHLESQQLEPMYTVYHHMNGIEPNYSTH